MNSNNIELKWRQEELIFLHGDLIEFECKQGYNFVQTTIPSPGRTQCSHGKLKYPKCIMQGKTIFIAFLIINLRPIQKIIALAVQAWNLL